MGGNHQGEAVFGLPEAVEDRGLEPPASASHSCGIRPHRGVDRPWAAWKRHPAGWSTVARTCARIGYPGTMAPQQITGGSTRGVDGRNPASHPHDPGLPGVFYRVDCTRCPDLYAPQTTQAPPLAGPYPMARPRLELGTPRFSVSHAHARRAGEGGRISADTGSSSCRVPWSWRWTLVDPVTWVRNRRAAPTRIVRRGARDRCGPRRARPASRRAMYACVARAHRSPEPVYVRQYGNNQGGHCGRA